jgi:predicted RNA-binding Zn ribbon-like protein
MRYEDYIANLARLAVDLVNDAAASGELLREHGIATPPAAELEPLLKLLRPAMATVAGSGDPGPVNRLLRRHPPRLQISWHDGRRHLHHAEDGEAPVSWLGRSCAAALAHVACGVPEVTIGRCRAAGCPRFFVDQSRNRSRRFCGNTCASRTTVAAYRSRRAGSA